MLGRTSLLLQGILFALSLVWFGLDAVIPLYVICVVFFFVSQLSLQIDHDDRASGTKLQVAHSIAEGGFLYITSFFFGVHIMPQDEPAHQVLLPLALLLVLILGKYLILGIVIGFLTVCAKIEAWFKRK